MKRVGLGLAECANTSEPLASNGLNIPVACKVLPPSGVSHLVWLARNNKERNGWMLWRADKRRRISCYSRHIFLTEIRGGQRAPQGVLLLYFLAFCPEQGSIAEKARQTEELKEQTGINLKAAAHGMQTHPTVPGFLR